VIVKRTFSTHLAWIWIIPFWVILQVAILMGQDYLGSAFFIPTLVRLYGSARPSYLFTLQWSHESTYDYHPDLTRTDEESAEPKLGDCSICMEPISSDQGNLTPNRSVVLLLCWTRVAKKRRVYALAPCGHGFVSQACPTMSTADSGLQHTSCLEQWMDIKSVCPQCRSSLPPL